VFGFSKSVYPSLIVGALIIMVGLTYSFGRDFGQTVGGWAENFGETMGTWGENFGESMGAWGENIGRTFSEWGMSFGRYFGASILIIIGILIVTNQLKRNPLYR
jgi:putative Mn2+ efflux pump MntP